MLILTSIRHLDDNHQNLVVEEQDEVKNWFEAQMHKAKKFQPLAVLNQKLKGLDVFESNDAPTPPQMSHSASSSTAHIVHEPAPVRRDPEEEVTRAQWQRLGYRDVCSDPLCARPITGSQMALGGSQPAVNCRQCGRLFCEEHTMYQMRLSRQAKHDPVRGIWCRVCETCYKSRDGYNDHHGFERDHFDDFAQIRRKRVDRERMEVSRLEKRLTKLTQLLANPLPVEETQSTGSWFSLSGAKNQRKALEQSIITWEEDAKVTNCPFCQQEFSTYTFRRHHCRMCGRVVCSDPKTECSTEIGLNVAADTQKSEKGTSQVSIDVRMCKDCQHTLFARSDFEREMADKPTDQRAYENLAQSIPQASSRATGSGQVSYSSAINRCYESAKEVNGRVRAIRRRCETDTRSPYRVTYTTAVAEGCVSAGLQLFKSSHASAAITTENLEARRAPRPTERRKRPSLHQVQQPLYR
jgi:rabenosyn-5